MTCPARTSLFFSSAIDLICALIFAPTSAFSRGQIVPTAVIGAAIVPFSALATLTLTVGVTSASAAVFELRTRQKISAASTSATTATPATINTVFRRCTSRSRRCWANSRSTSSSPMRLRSSLMKCSSAPGCLSQTPERGLVVEDCLVQRRSLFDQHCLRIGDFDYRCLAGAITRNRRCKVVLGLRHAAARQRDAADGAFDLRARRVVLLREPAQRDGPFVFRELKSKLRLS